MPWIDEIDELRPQDTEFVSEGAMRFRELKRALIERLVTAYKEFPGEHPDREGEALLFPIVSVQVGTEAQKPELPDREGMGWFSTDTGILWIGDRDEVWQSVGGGGDDSDPTPTNTKSGTTTELEQLFLGSGSIRTFLLWIEDPVDITFPKINQLRSISLRAIDPNVSWDGRIAHGPGGRTQVSTLGPEGVLFTLLGVHSAVSGSERRYFARVLAEGMGESSFSNIEVDLIINWSFWLDT